MAPSVNQYLPAGHETELSDIDYLVLQGANDQDISVFLGNEQYENVSFSKDGYYIAPRSISPVRITDNSIQNGESMISEDRFPCG